MMLASYMNFSLEAMGQRMKLILRLLTVFLVLGFIFFCLVQESKAELNVVQDIRSNAEQGDATAQYYLGLMYYRGDGVLQDFQKAIYWFTKAAEQGSWHAQRGLGMAYSEGKGVLQNYVIAYAWFNIAASQNIDVAKTNRETLSKKMTPNQIEEGQKLSKELYDKIYNQTK
jgi:TPR repeat protein